MKYVKSAFVMLIGLCQVGYAHPTKISGGGEFFRPDSATGTPNSTIGMEVIAKMNTKGTASGRISLHSSNRKDSTAVGNVTHFDSEIAVNCVAILSEEKGELDLMVSGYKLLGSQTSYVQRITSDTSQYATSQPIDTSGDRIVGRLKINIDTGKVERSDWTSGQEVCAGISSISALNEQSQALGKGIGNQSIGAFQQCENRSVFLSKEIQTLIPKCTTAGEYEFVLDRELRSPNTISFR